MEYKEMALKMISDMEFYGIAVDDKEVGDFLYESERGTDGFWSLVAYYGEKLREATI